MALEAMFAEQLDDHLEELGASFQPQRLSHTSITRVGLTIRRGLILRS